MGGLESLKQLNLFDVLESVDNVCLVSSVMFKDMIGGLHKRTLNRRMVNVNSSFLNSSVLNPRLLDPSTYKHCPLDDASTITTDDETIDPAPAIAASSKIWRKWVFVYHTSTKNIEDFDHFCVHQLESEFDVAQREHAQLRGHCCKKLYQVQLTDPNFVVGMDSFQT